MRVTGYNSGGRGYPSPALHAARGSERGRQASPCLAFCLKILPFASKPRELAFAFILTLIAPWLQISEARAQSYTNGVGIDYTWQVVTTIQGPTLQLNFSGDWVWRYDCWGNTNLDNANIFDTWVWQGVIFPTMGVYGEPEHFDLPINQIQEYFTILVEPRSATNAIFGRSKMPTAFVTTPQPVVASPNRLRVIGNAEPIIIPELMPIGWKPGE